MTDLQQPPDAERDAPVSERDRMITNVAVVLVVIALIGAGVWIANAILEMRRIQDCVMAGRRNCAPIATPGRESWDVPTSSR
jgi:hypothetical protein